MFGSGRMLMISERKSAPITAPTYEPFPPRRLAPPSTAAAMLVSAKPEPTRASPIPTWAMRKNPASVAIKEQAMKARQLIASEGMPIRRDDASSEPTARAVSPPAVR